MLHDCLHCRSVYGSGRIVSRNRGAKFIAVLDGVTAPPVAGSAVATDAGGCGFRASYSSDSAGAGVARVASSPSYSSVAGTPVAVVSPANFSAILIEAEASILGAKCVVSASEHWEAVGAYVEPFAKKAFLQ